MLPAVHQVMEGLPAEALAGIEEVHPTTAERWMERARQQAEQAHQEVIQQLTTEVVEMDELHSFAGNKQDAPQQ